MSEGAKGCSFVRRSSEEVVEERVATRRAVGAAVRAARRHRRREETIRRDSAPLGSTSRRVERRPSRSRLESTRVCGRSHSWNP